LAVSLVMQFMKSSTVSPSFYTRVPNSHLICCAFASRMRWTLMCILLITSHTTTVDDHRSWRLDSMLAGTERNIATSANQSCR
jgi:predicted metal-dependent enzyme (double-stranded beta helix superfamily)